MIGRLVINCGRLRTSRRVFAHAAATTCVFPAADLTFSLGSAAGLLLAATGTCEPPQPRAGFRAAERTYTEALPHRCAGPGCRLAGD